MIIPCHHIGAFSRRQMGGNPAAVCLLPRWLADGVLQRIAAEFNLSETAFVVDAGTRFELRWFTPSLEMDLCGHATLASAWVICEKVFPGRSRVDFHTRSGVLPVTRGLDGALTLDFPAMPAKHCECPAFLVEGLGARPVETHRARDVLAVFATEEEVAALKPDFAMLAKVEGALGIIATAASDPHRGDFVSRFFAPRAGVNEDPVTGSAHCTLSPFWSQRLGRNPLMARQISARGGELECKTTGDRVLMTGYATAFYEGRIELEEG